MSTDLQVTHTEKSAFQHSSDHAKMNANETFDRNATTSLDGCEKSHNIDDLLASLESDDEVETHVCKEVATAGATQNIPKSLLQTNPCTGLTSDDASMRRKRFGSNQMEEEKHNYVKQFFMFFGGPIPFAMMASIELNLLG